MENVVFESEIYAKNARGILPFQIMIVEEKEGDINSLRVIRKEFTPSLEPIDKKVQTLVTSIWKDGQNE